MVKIFTALTWIFLIDISYCQAKCTHTFVYQFSHDTLYMQTSYDSECGSSDYSTTVDLGNGDQMSWNDYFQKIYVYHCNGSFHMIGKVLGKTCADSILKVTDYPACEPDFNYSISYNTASEDYTVKCLMDSCSRMFPHWTSLIFQQFSDTATFIYPKEYDGTVQNICLNSAYNCPEEEICKSFLLSQQTATIIDVPTSAPPSIRFFPNPARDYVEVMITNIEERIDAEIYSVDGRKEMAETINPSMWRSETKIDLSSLLPGVYLVSISAPGKFYGMQKLVKQ